MKKYRCPWCGVSLENQKISNIPKKKIPSMFIYGKCETCNNYYGQNHLSSRVILCAVLMLCTIPAMIFLYKFLILIFLVLFGLSLFIIRTPLVKMEYEEKLSTNENEPLDYTKVFEIAQKDFREVLETCEREIDNEFIECLGKDYSNAYSNTNLFILIYSVAVFIAVNSIKISNYNIKIKKIIEMLSKLSFGVYIVHPVIQTAFTKIFQYSGNPLLYILSYFVVAIVLSFTCCYVVSKIPIIKKVIRA